MLNKAAHIGIVAVLAAHIALNLLVPTAVAAEPTKEALIKTLEKFHGLLEQKKYTEAAKMIIAPPDFNPERLSGTLERRELSSAGIRVLSAKAKFGKASQVFEKDRAKHFTQRAKVDIEQCYGFNHEQDGSFGEVIGLWDGRSFRLLRVDDVGKLADAPSTPPGQSPPGPLTKKDLMQMLPGLRAAVEAKPDDIAARGRYAQALFRVGNLPEAWKQLRFGHKLDSKHGGIARGYEDVFRGFEKMGAFTVGVPTTTIENLLGAPDKIVEMSWGKRWVYFYYAVEMIDNRVHETVDLRGATKEWFQPTEIVQVNLDGRGWRCGIRRKAKGQITAIYFPVGQMISNWVEQFEIERIVGGAKAGTPKAIGELAVTQITTRVPNAKAKLLETTEDSVYVAAQLPTPEGKTRHQLIRMFRTDQDIHRISYTIKADKLDAETQKKWFKILQQASLKPVAKPTSKP